MPLVLGLAPKDIVLLALSRLVCAIGAGQWPHQHDAGRGAGRDLRGVSLPVDRAVNLRR